MALNLTRLIGIRLRQVVSTSFLTPAFHPSINLQRYRRRHYNPKWEKLRALIVIKVEPNFSEKPEDLTPEQTRSKTKECRILPPMCTTGGKLEAFMPPKGDRKISPITMQVHCTLHQEQVLDVLKRIAAEENLQVTVKQSAKGGLVSVIGACIGSILLGSLGAAAGAIAATVISYFVSGQKQSEVELLNNLRGAVMRGTGACMGALLWGPYGATAGAIAGSVMSYFTSGQQQSVIELLNNLKPEDKQKLADSCSKVFENLEITNVKFAAMFIMNNECLKMIVIDNIINFLKNSMST